MRFAALLLLVLFAGPILAQDQMEFPEEVRGWYWNPDGSCVQCSIGMCGVWQNCPQASTLLWTTDAYGRAVRGGSYPSRVEAYADERKIPIYNVTGNDVYDWMKWASDTGRMAAIGCFSRHFQTLVWYDRTDTEKPWRVCNNNSTSRIDRYTESEFRRHHEASGKWVVILKTPSPPAKPVYVKWWE